MIDLRSDQSALRAYFYGRVHQYGVSPDLPIVGLVSVGFQFDQCGWVTLHFDTRQLPKWDGDWTSHLSGQTTNFDHWFQAVDQLCEDQRSFALVDLAGVRHRITTQTVAAQGIDFYFARLFGIFLRDSMATFIADGVFSALPKSPRCPYIIESIPGGFTWPPPSDHGTKNLL